MPVFGKSRNFHKKFKFIVELDGITFAGFNKCSELSAEIAEVPYREGGVVLAIKDPGLVTIPDVTLERGVCFDQDMFNWFKTTINLISQQGLVDPNFRRSGRIIQGDRDGSELASYPINSCWPKKFVAGEWDNEASENVIQKVTLSVHDWDIQSFQ